MACATCNDQGFVTHNVPVGHPDFGKAFPCPACGGPRDLAERAWRNLEQHFGDYWMFGSPKMHEFDLQAFVEMPHELARGKQAMNMALLVWATNDLMTYEDVGLPDPTYGHIPASALVLSGLPGLGKTCGAAAAFETRREGRPALAIEYNALISAIQDKYGDQHADSGAAVRAVSNVPLLFLDDFGNMDRRRPETENRQEIMFNILNHRYNYRLPTIITTNLNPAMMEDQFGEKLTRRVRGWPVWVDVSGAGLDLRPGA